MANTTNFGWETPDDTDLVKDGASAMRTLGNAIDTSLVDLKGGTTGQVLSKASNTDMDFTWSSVDPLTILDAKGDLISATAADSPARLAVGADGTYLQADSTTSTGLKWGSVSAGGMTLIQETTASALSSLSFSSIPNSYKNLLLVWDGIYHSTSGSAFDIRFNNDSNSNYRIRGVLTENGGNTGTNTSDNAAAGYSAYNSAAYFGIENNVTSTQYVWQTFGSMLILNYASTTRFKTYVGNYGYRKAPYSVNVFSNEQTCLYSSTSAITSIDIVRLAGTATFSNATSTSIRLFGVN